MRFKSYLMSTTVIAGVAGILAAASVSPAHAQEEEASGFETSGSVSIGTDYVFRGISQTLEDPTIQGSVDIGINGFYAGAWASNLNFGDGDEAHIELDLYAGYGNEIEKFSYDVGVIWYLYPGADNDLEYDFFELQGNVGYDLGPVGVSAGVNFSPEFFGKVGNATYLSGGVSWPVHDRVSIDGHIGRQWTKVGDYTDWSIGATFSAAGFDFGVTYYDTNLSDIDLGGDNDIADGRIVASISRSF